MFSSFEVSREYPTTHAVSFGEHNTVFSSKKHKIKKIFLKIFFQKFIPPPLPPPPANLTVLVVRAKL